MAKRPSIIETLTAPAETAAAASATVVELPARRRNWLDAFQHTSIYVPKPAYERLREIAFVERRKLSELIMEGIDDVIARRGHSETASKRKA